MTLRMRALIASSVALAAVFVMVVALLAQYAVTAAASITVHSTLSPLVDTSHSLTLTQANASGALSDYIMLNRQPPLDDYRQTIGMATTLLDEIDAGIPEGSAELTDLVARARLAQRTWVKSDADPVIALMDASKRARAMKETNTREATAAYDEMVLASSNLLQALNQNRDKAAEVGASFTRLLGASLLAVGLLLALALVLLYAGLQSWVLAPLNALRSDLQSAANEPGHLTPIRPSGPPELRAVAIDGESLRRGLVHEIDEATSAREGLVQDAPLVAAILAELAPHPAEPLPDLLVAGTTQSAEGMVAGDWWDTVRRPDGSLAIVIADVSGHGPEASITAVRVRSVLRAGLLSGMSLDVVVSMAAHACADDEHFVTAILLVVDPTRGLLEWCNAGHHPAIVVTRDKDATLCEPTGPLVSSLGGAWTVLSRPFDPGDVLVAFTDGLVESRNADGDELESSMVSQLIRGMDAPVRENPSELISQLMAQVRHRAADWRRDDVSIVAAARRH